MPSDNGQPLKPGPTLKNINPQTFQVDLKSLVDMEVAQTPYELSQSISREADVKMCHGDVTRLLGLATGRQVRNATTGLAAPQEKSGRRLGEGQGHLSDDPPGH
ncbi:hypothetical protein DUI87_02137 [Hirundo rustica rustica]|uniref:Uncharacterized protein n=1 Tax=Hirundo rustica rustica TaxID=333673 RepID=A0A3M0L8G3_HIRRU|nr:hypothetical protein DUI87_02137 [Hirundo rustica rustica]